MLNLLTFLSVRLLARVPTVLAVPVLELELVFERTLRKHLVDPILYRDHIGRRRGRTSMEVRSPATPLRDIDGPDLTYSVHTQ